DSSHCVPVSGEGRVSAGSVTQSDSVAASHQMASSAAAQAAPGHDGRSAAVNPPSRHRALLAWSVSFCSGALWIGRQHYVDQYERFFQDTSVAQRMSSQKTVQHEAVLATSSASSHPPAPERSFPSSRPAMPQLQALGYSPDGAWAGSTAEPPGSRAAVEQARTSGRPVTSPSDAARYWSVAPSSWSSSVDARELVPAADFPAGSANSTLAIGEQPSPSSQRQPAPVGPGWP
ncbi:hypothetical protein OY671_008716, partial [Metschnikowia pulcherrima]